jgi:hypothetical protein
VDCAVRRLELPVALFRFPSRNRIITTIALVAPNLALPPTPLRMVSDLQGSDIPFPPMSRPFDYYLDAVRSMTAVDVRRIFQNGPQALTTLKEAVIYFASIHVHTTSSRENETEYLESLPWISTRHVPAHRCPKGDIIFQVDQSGEHGFRYTYPDRDYVPTKLRIVLHSQNNLGGSLRSGFQADCAECGLDGATVESLQRLP